MPRRNVLKEYLPDNYYHIYSRGVNKEPIFLSDKDYVVFLSLLKRYLSIEPTKNVNSVQYPHLYGKLELLSYCLLRNHLHLLIYQTDQSAMVTLMRGLMTSYSRYFNKTHKRFGPLFESRYKASLISNQAYLEHISRYIHLNPKSWRTYSYSSLTYTLGDQKAEWMKPTKITNLYKSKEKYLEFLSDYEDYKKTLDEIKTELANG